MKDLVKKLLNVDPSNRPSVHEILSSSVISKRIKGFLKESVRLREFSHTILHNQVFLLKTGYFYSFLPFLEAENSKTTIYKSDQKCTRWWKKVKIT